MTDKTLAKRAADELNVEGYGWRSDANCPTMQTAMRLITKNDALRSQSHD